MKHTAKRTLTALLALLTLASAFASCSSGDNSADTTADTSSDVTVTETAETGTSEPDLPELDYDGADFTYLVRYAEKGKITYRDTYVYTEAYDGEVVNDAVYDRNRQVEEKFNIKIKMIPTLTDNGENELTKQYVLANDSTLDAICGMSFRLGAIAAEQYFQDFNDIPYVTLDAPYWSENAAEQLSIADRNYLMPCDISLMSFAGARYICFNKKLVQDYKFDMPYDLVASDSWNFDTFFAMVNSVSSDLNGDGEYNEHDLYGFLTEDTATLWHFLAAAGVRFTENDEYGMPVMSVMNEKTQSVMERIHSELEGKNTSIAYQTLQKTADIGDFSNVYTYARSLFCNDRFMFVQLGTMSLHEFKDMESDFGVVPNPKFDEDQDNYHHRDDKYATLFAVPVTAADAERVGAVMEYSAWLSNKLVLPAYYETTILNKRIRDERDIEMLDIIKSSCHYEVSALYNIGIDNMLWKAYQNDANLASTYASEQSAIEKKIEQLYESFEF